MAERAGIPDSLKAVAEALGVIAGSGAGFAALSFGIGYLATKHHDAMLGVPTTTTDQTTYVRTGALFFSQTLHDVVAFIASISLKAVLTALLIIFVALLLKDVPSIVAKRVEWKVRRGTLAVIASVVVLVSCLVTLPYHLAALDPGNKNLLFEQRPVDGTAKYVNGALRGVNGESALHQLYGWQWTRILLLALGLMGARRLVQNAETPVPNDPNPIPRAALDTSRRILQPVALGAIVTMTATTPANYGVLAMSTSLPCVQLYKGEDSELGLPGFLFSDLSSEKAQVAVLRWDAENRTYFVDLHARDSLRLIEVTACGVRNPIHRIIGSTGT